MNLNSYLPEHLQNSKSMVELQTLLSKKCDEMSEAINKMTNELFIKSTENFLNRYEKIFKINNMSDKSIEVRKLRLLTCLKMPFGTLTKKKLQGILETFDGGKAEIIEDYENYTFIAKFNDFYRVPNDETMFEIFKVVDVLKPVHLLFIYSYTYNWWEVGNLGEWGKVRTWDDLRNYQEV